MLWKYPDLRLLSLVFVRKFFSYCGPALAFWCKEFITSLFFAATFFSYFFGLYVTGISNRSLFNILVFLFLRCSGSVFLIFLGVGV